MGNTVFFSCTHTRTHTHTRVPARTKDVLSKIVSYRTLKLSPTDQHTITTLDSLKKSFSKLNNWNKIIVGLVLFKVDTWNHLKIDINNYMLITDNDVCSNWIMIEKHIYRTALETVDDIVFVRTIPNGRNKRMQIYTVQFHIEKLQMVIKPFRMINTFCKILTEYPDTTFSDLTFCSLEGDTALNGRTALIQYFTIFIFEYLGYKYYYRTMYRINLCDDLLGCWFDR